MKYLLAWHWTVWSLEAADWTAIFTLGLLLITIAYVAVTFCLWKNAQGQLATLRKMFATQHNPYLGIKSVSLIQDKTSFKKRVGVNVIIKNYGNLPAQNALLKLGVAWDGGKLDDLEDSTGPSNILFPDDDLPIFVDVPLNFYFEILRGARPLVVRALLSYEGVDKETYTYETLTSYNSKQHQFEVDVAKLHKVKKSENNDREKVEQTSKAAGIKIV